MGAPRRAGSYKLRESIFILGGPLANLAIIAVCYLTWPGGVAIDTGAFQGSDPALMLILSNGLLLFSSLWPRRYESRQGKAPNDILLLWETARYSRKQVEQMPAHWYFLEGEESREQGRYTEANEWIAKGLKLFPNNYFLEWLQASNLMDLQSYTDARKAYVRLLGRYSKSEELRFTAFNNIAYTNVLSGDAELLEEAEICSRVAVEKYPFNFYFVGTRGSVLIELREYESGLKLLHQALKQHTERDARALNACYIAIGEARLGNVNESRHFFAMARKLDPNCLLLERESHELGS